MAGELITDDWQMEYRGVLLGSGTAFDIVDIQGLLDLPEIHTADRLRLRRHGLYPGDDFAGRRSVTVTFEVDADTVDDLNGAVATLLALTRPGLEESPLSLQIPGVAGGSKRRIYARPRRRVAPVNLDFFYGLPMVKVEFVATDPRIYDDTLQSVATGLPSESGGLVFPALEPFAFSATAERGEVEVTNSGTFPTDPVLRIDGPVTGPSVTLLSTGETLAFPDLEIAAGGDFLLIDLASRSVLLNGTASRYAFLSPTSTWWSLEEGPATMQFRSNSNAEPATLRVTHRSAWL